MDNKKFLKYKISKICKFLFEENLKKNFFLSSCGGSTGRNDRIFSWVRGDF